MLIHKAYLCEEVHHHSRAHGVAQQKAKDTIAELRTVASPRVRESLRNLEERVDSASTDQLIAIMRQAIATTRLLATVRPQLIADIYAKHWT